MDTSIVSDPSQDPHSFEGNVQVQLALSKADVVIENGGVKLLFRGEVAKDHRLGDTCRLGNFLGGCAAKASFRKEAYGHRQNLKPAFFAGHPGTTYRALNCHLLTQSFSLLPLPSTT